MTTTIGEIQMAAAEEASWDFACRHGRYERPTAEVFTQVCNDLEFKDVVENGVIFQAGYYAFLTHYDYVWEELENGSRDGYTILTERFDEACDRAYNTAKDEP